MSLRSTDLLAWLAALPPDARDAAIDAHLGIARDACAPSTASPGEHLVGYHASGVAPIVHALDAVPVIAHDVVIDLGAGLGKVVALAHLLTGATARGIELQPDLVARAREEAARRAIDVEHQCADAREAPLDDGTVFFLYAPFTGPVLAEVVARLHAVACRHAIVVCALGIDLPREAAWLRRRSLDAFWLAIYDSDVPNAEVAPRVASASTLGPLAELIAHERVSTVRTPTP